MSKIQNSGAVKSRYFPGIDRMQSPGGMAEVFFTSEASLANHRNRKRGFPYLRQAGKIIYDVDQCYEMALAAGSGSGSEVA